MHFFGKTSRTHIDSIPNYDVSVPIKLVNELTKTVKHLELKVDWVSVSKVSDCLYKPDIGLCIFKNSEEKMVRRERTLEEFEELKTSNCLYFQYEIQNQTTRYDQTK